jgi:hypothetical protein
MTFIRICHTCSKERGEIIEVTFLRAVIHRCKGHEIRSGNIQNAV